MMTDKEKALSSVGALDKAEEQGAASRQATNSENYFTMMSKQRQGVISRFLLQGRRNALKGDELAKITGMDVRTVRGQISRERKAGIAICSDSRDGYYLPASLDELRRSAKSLAHRAIETQAVAQAMADAVADAEGQQHIDGWR